jgi:hypothetical protein
MLKEEIGLDREAIEQAIAQAELAARGSNRDEVTGQLGPWE